MEAQDLIERSVSHTEIAHAAWSEALADELALECEDSVETGEVVEYWGTRPDGAEWRVHLRRPIEPPRVIGAWHADPYAGPWARKSRD